MSNKALLTNYAKEYGREFLDAYTIGVIQGIVKLDHINSGEKIIEIDEVLKELNLISNDSTFPWSISGTKKASAPTEAEKEKSQVDCTTELAKVESSAKGGFSNA